MSRPERDAPPPRACVLVVDDERSVRFTLRAILEDEEGLAVLEAADAAEALETLRLRPDLELVLTDLKMPGHDGMWLLERLAALPGAPPAIMITAHGSERAAVAAIRAGALDYFAKPFDTDDVLRVVRRSLHTAALRRENTSLRARLTLAQHMVFESPAIQRVAELVERVAPRDVPVLIVGESGTGKELVARSLVERSPRARAPFVRFNCAALPGELAAAELFGHTRGAFTGAAQARRGLFREAHGGTLFLDEVDALDPKAQGALLRALQEGEVRPVGEDRAASVDVRVLAATSKDLGSLPGFRPDLYYRLHVVTIALPPLRERPEDVAPLARHFAHRYGERFGLAGARLSDRMLARLQARSWPGNVRELEHAIQRLVALSTTALIDDDPFPDPASGEAVAPPSLKERVDAFEKGLLAEALAQTRGNRSEAARQLSVSRMTLVTKLKKHGLDQRGDEPAQEPRAT